MQIKHLLQSGLLAASVACGAEAQNVVLYSSNNTETIETALEAVKKKSPSLNVQPVTGGTGTMMKRIEAEAQNPRGDLFWSGGFGTLGAYRQHLQPYRPADLDKIPAEFRGPDDLWVGTNVHVMVLMVNERQLKGLAAPASWSDLMQPQWKGKFAITDPSKSGTAYMLVYGLQAVRPGRPGQDRGQRRGHGLVGHHLQGRGGGRIRRRHDAGIRRPGICRRRPEGDQAGLPGRGQLPGAGRHVHHQGRQERAGRPGAV